MKDWKVLNEKCPVCQSNLKHRVISKNVHGVWCSNAFCTNPETNDGAYGTTEEMALGMFETLNKLTATNEHCLPNVR